MPKKTPTKVKTYDLKYVQEKVGKFCTELDTTFKACLYSVMKNETHDISESLEILRRKTKAFHGEITSLTECIKNIAAIIQKEAMLEQHTKGLDREKNDLQKEIKDLKRLRELREIENLLNQSDDYDVWCSLPKQAKGEEDNKGIIHLIVIFKYKTCTL